MNSQTAAWPPQRIARIAGFLLLLTIGAGGFGELYIPNEVIVPTDAAATAKNILTSEWMFRLGFAGYVIEALCDVGLTWAFYLLLKPAGRELALLAAWLRIVSTAVFAAAELFYLVPLLLLRGAPYLKTFSTEQLQTLALLSLKLYAYGAIVPTIFYGVCWIILGWLMIRSGYLPKLLGALMMLAGLGFVLRNFALFLVPAYASPYLMLPMFVGSLLLTFWLLVRGVNLRKWQEAVAPVE
jgi:hypothetical protein